MDTEKIDEMLKQLEDYCDKCQNSSVVVTLSHKELHTIWVALLDYADTISVDDNSKDYHAHIMELADKINKFNA